MRSQRRSSVVAILHGRASSVARASLFAFNTCVIVQGKLLLCKSKERHCQLSFGHELTNLFQRGALPLEFLELDLGIQDPLFFYYVTVAN